MIVELGEVAAPSGTLLLIDAGMLGLWSHDRPPWLDPELWGPNAERANGGVDLVARGRDGLEAVRRFDRASAGPPYVFDIPAGAVASVQGDFGALAARLGLDARLEPAGRLPHRGRVAAVLAASPGLATVPYHGMWAIAADGLPRDRRFPVRATPMPAGSGAEGCWSSVWVELSEAEVASSEGPLQVLVDRARLMFADVDAIGGWEHDRTLDGRYDVAFWGRDAEEVARAVGAPPLPKEPRAFGWTDLDRDAARGAHDRVVAVKQRGLKVALDWRPHSHDFQLLAQVRASEHRAGVVALDGVPVCGFETTWGDGAFDVYRDLAADGTPVRLRVELGTIASGDDG